MTERLVDIILHGRVLHTFPVSLSESGNQGEAAFRKKALEAAANAQLVSYEELSSLQARMHISRSGPLEPDLDPLGALAETRQGLEQFDRDRAYYLWLQAGRPAGRAEQFWHLAQEERWRKRAYELWERESRPTGKADEHWFRTRNFEMNS